MLETCSLKVNIIINISSYLFRSFDNDDDEKEKAPLNIDAIINKTRKKTSFSSDKTSSKGDKGESEGDRSGGNEGRSRMGKSRQTFAGNAVYKNLL